MKPDKDRNKFLSEGKGINQENLLPEKPLYDSVHSDSEHRIALATILRTNHWDKSTKYRIVWYNLYVAHRHPQQGGVCMEVVISFLVAVLAGVACHYIIKWLDSDDKSNN